MTGLSRFLTNHVLANLTFGLVLVIGVISYIQMPRAKDPEINFNWIHILTVYPGASATDVERRITDPLEQALQRSVGDIKFVSSTSRESISNILVRFERIDEEVFDERLADLRREMQNTYNSDLPASAIDPEIYEVTTSNAFPVASVVVKSAGADENFRRQIKNIKRDLELIDGVDRVDALGLDDPELHVTFMPERLVGLGVTPGDLADTVRAYFRDVSAGDVRTDDGQWLVRIAGTNRDPDSLAEYPITTAKGIVPLGELATLTRSVKEPSVITRWNGEPAVFLAITKKASANVLDLVDNIEIYITMRNLFVDRTGVQLLLADDQTVITRTALNLMQTNALIGFLMVLLVTWIFFGPRISFLTSIGIPFTLAGTFLVLNIAGISLNNTVLLGIVIVLGMLVDDAVVVVESIYQRLCHGSAPIQAVIDSFKEVFAPVTASVLTTMAAFLPLMLMPGILGEFMRIIPIVVTLALAISLIEAYWMLPVHVIISGIDLSRRSVMQLWRERLKHWLRYCYIGWLLKALRYPRRSLVAVVTVFGLAVLIISSGHIRFNFFEAGAIRLFYVNIDMPKGTTLKETSNALYGFEERALQAIHPGELRSMVSYAGQQFAETSPLFGDTVGQIMVSLNPNTSRSVDEIADAVERVVVDTASHADVSLLKLKDGPPTSSDINIKVRGDTFPEINAAVADLRQFMERSPIYQNVNVDTDPGNPEMVLRYDGAAIQRAGLSPLQVSRSIEMLADGEEVTDFQDQGEKVTVRVKARQEWRNVDELLQQTIPTADGHPVAIGTLVKADYGLSIGSIRHYNYRKTVTITADVDKAKADALVANNLLMDEWQKQQSKHSTIDLDFTGILDDINESLDALIILFLLGVGLMYIILGTQFKSYFQPLMILVTIPLAFTGVVFGLWITDNPLSLYTLYGVVALAGISVNAAIVLISAANTRLAAGMSVLHATVYAARRRVIPVLITSLTTIAGLMSLALGLTGKSLIWGPVATAIVWGLGFSTVLTLFVIPMLYRSFMVRGHR